MDVFEITGQALTSDALKRASKKGMQLILSEKAKAAITHCRAYLENKIADSDTLYYGINTGLGSLCNVAISKAEIRALQVNLVRSHACGTGQEIPQDIVRLMLLLKIHSLSLGHSGVRTVLVEHLIALYNHQITPVVYEFGSLGASGDLAPLAHMALTLMGEGEAYYQGKRIASSQALKAAGIAPIVLEAKEGLALLNGTQFMNAFGLFLAWEGKELLRKANRIAALSIDVYRAHSEPFHPAIHKARNQKGQQIVAATILDHLKGSELQQDAKMDVQDPYSFRCIPQVHGATLDVLEHTEKLMVNEANSATDNPLIFPAQDLILSGGNFHGQPLALALDSLALAISELGSISERRLYKLISGKRDLPPYLIAKPGLNSGLMIAQYTAAAIVSRNKQLCTPASVDTIPSSAGQEDHVSMGANAATKCYSVWKNTEELLAIEWLAAAQGLSFRRPKKTSPSLETLVKNFRSHVPFIEEDTYLAPLVRKSIAFLRQ